jgi:hypothetical protein
MNFNGALSTVVNTTAGAYSLVSSKASAAGSGIVRVEQPGTSLCAPATPVQLSYTVNPASTSIRPTNPPASGTQVYGSTNPTLTYTLQGIQPGDQVHLAVVSGVTASTPVGSYTATVALVGQSAANYTLTTTTLPFTVTPAPLTLAAADAYQLVGATPGPFTYQFIGLQNGDSASVVSGTPTLTTTATASSGAGTYAITPTIGTLSAANYSFAGLIPGELNIFAPINLGYANVGSVAVQNLTFPAGSFIPAATAEMLTGGNPTGVFGAGLYHCTAGSPGACTRISRSRRQLRAYLPVPSSSSTRPLPPSCWSPFLSSVQALHLRLRSPAERNQ